MPIELPINLNKDYFLKDPVGKTIFWLGCLVIVLLIAFFLVVLPRTRDVFSKREELNSLEAQYQELNGKINLLSNWDWQEVEGKAKLTQLAFPARKDIYLVLFAIQDPCRRNGFVVNKMSFDLGEIETATGSAATSPKADSSSGLESINIELEVFGYQDRLGLLLTGLDESLPLMSIEDFSFFSSVEKSNLVTAKMKLKMFFSPTTVALKKAEQISPKDLEFTQEEIKTISQIENYYNKTGDFYQKLEIYEEIGTIKEATLPAGERNPFARF